MLAALALGATGLVNAATAAAAPARWSQVTELSFQRLTQDQGLPNEIATDVAEDGAGFVWVGTLGGLARWDGYRFRVYRADPRTAGALPDNVIQTVHGDAAGRLWVGTSAAGLVRYDPATDRFVTTAAGPQGLSHVSVHAIVDDGSGGLWVGTDGGLDHVDPMTGAVHRGGDGLPGLQGNAVQVLLRDRSGRLWAGTENGLFRRDNGAARFVGVPLGGTSDPQPEPMSLLEDAGGRVWVGTLRHGAFIVDSGDAVQPVAGAALQTQQINAIVEVRPGEIWLGTAGQGIVAVDAASGATRQIRHRPMLPMSLSDNAVRNLHRDRAGLIWVPTNHGVNRHDPGQSAILTMFGASAAEEGADVASTEISWILPLDDGRIWLGTHKRGIAIIDDSGRPAGALRPDAAHSDTALPQDAVLALERGGDDTVFVGTKRGLYRATADGRRVGRVAFAGRHPNASTWALLKDGGTLWIGGQSDGLWQLDLASGRARPARHEPAQPLSDQRITVLARGPAGSLWVGTRYGLNRYDPARGAVTQALPAPNTPQGLSGGFISTLYTDRQGRLWVGTYGGGINILEEGAGDLAQARFRHLGVAQGLPDDNVNALLEDAKGQVWVSTDNGLAVVDPATLALRALRRAEGVVFATYWSGAAARTAQGELLFGGAGGLSIVRPDQLQTWNYRPPLLVTEVRVGGRPVLAGAPLTVPADANSLAVEFAAADYSAPERNRYAYRLEGFESHWVETDATRRLAAYTNLPPGRYTLQLRGSNRDGIWSEAGVSLPVEVLAAWHQTWWARATGVLAMLLVLLAVVRWRTRLLRRQQAELEHKVNERTAELHKVSLALEEKSRVLEQSSLTDPLTGLHNRRFLTARIDVEVGASVRRAVEARAAGVVHPVDTDNVFLLIDIDHFKLVNDVHGHAAGDAVLVQFGQRLQTLVRESDFLVRWGGEEFLAVARNTDRDRAEELAERIRSVVAERPFALDDGRSLVLTCSIGFATMPFALQQPRALGWQDVVKLADLALLAAKRVGRNAWVGLQTGESAAVDGLVAQLQADPQRVLRGGEVGFTSNRPRAAVAAALGGQDGAAAGRVDTARIG
jgi:diguanylate cyclase (GGDEF)-like protein